MILNSPSFRQLKSRGIKLDADAKAFFEEWAFNIDRCYWDIFGVKYVSWIDQEKAKLLRAEKVIELLANNLDMSEKEAKSQAVKLVRPKKYGWALYQADIFDFSEGYLFNHKYKNYSVQILGYASDAFILLFFDQTKKRYIKLADVHFSQFFEFLKTGDSWFLKDRDSMALPESALKYEIKKHLQGNSQSV